MAKKITIYCQGVLCVDYRYCCIVVNMILAESRSEFTTDAPTHSELVDLCIKYTRIIQHEQDFFQNVILFAAFLAANFYTTYLSTDRLWKFCHKFHNARIFVRRSYFLHMVLQLFR